MRVCIAFGSMWLESDSEVFVSVVAYLLSSN